MLSPTAREERPRVAEANAHALTAIRPYWRCLAEIHAAPQWLWPAMVLENTLRCRSNPPPVLVAPREGGSRNLGKILSKLGMIRDARGRKAEPPGNRPEVKEVPRPRVLPGPQVMRVRPAPAISSARVGNRTGIPRANRPRLVQERRQHLRLGLRPNAVKVVIDHQRMAGDGELSGVGLARALRLGSIGRGLPGRPDPRRKGEVSA